VGNPQIFCEITAVITGMGTAPHYQHFFKKLEDLTALRTQEQTEDFMHQNNNTKEYIISSK